jgi:predicted permease
MSVVARLADGANQAGVQASLASQSAELSRLYPTAQTGMTLTAVRINDRYNGRLTDGVWIAFGGVAIVVLLIACANAANLLLVRAARRGHEIAVRASIGASRAHIVRQLLAESVALALVSGVAGAVLSAMGLYLLNLIIPANTLAYWMKFELDARGLAVLLAVCLGTVLVFGLAPAVHVARADVSALIKSGGRAGFGGLRGRRWMLVFLTAECGLTMVLLNAIVTGVRTTREVGRRFVPIDAANVLTTWVTLPADRYRTPDARRSFYAAVDERIAAMPGVSVTALATALPLGGASARTVTVDGVTRGPNETPPTAWTVTISSRYFDAIGVPLAGGRSFDARDGWPGYESAIVNQRFVDEFFGGGDVIGRRLGLSDPVAPAAPPSWLTVVGVVPSVRQRPQATEPDSIVYLPLAAAPPASGVLFVRGGGATSSAPELREAVRVIDPELPLYRTLPMAQALDASNWQGRVSEFLLNGIVVVAICLAGIGLYAVMAHTVLQRTREIGIRVALGARRRGLVAMMARSAVAYLAFGSAAGLLCVAGFARLMESGAGSGSAPYQLSDPATSMAAVGLLALITAVASIAPAWRATRVDPGRVLREG